MAIVVRSADLDLDRERLIATLFQYLTPLADGRRFEWLYRDNPHGPARAWIAEDTDDGGIVGAAAAFPRRMYLSGKEALSCVLGDFCISARYRSLGPALQLQRACLAEFNTGSLAFGYDFPSASMTAVYSRLGVEPRERVVRLAKPLCAERQIRKLVKSRPLVRGLSAVADSWLAFRDRETQDGSECTIVPQAGACGEQFTALAEQVGTRYGVCVQRSAEYLNWRYRDHPFRRYEMLTARRDGALQGYAVFEQTAEDATLVDLFGLEEPEVLRSLIVHVVALLRERRAATVSAPLLASHPWVKLFTSLGFRSRESCPVVIYKFVHGPESRSCLCGFPVVFDGWRS